MCKFNHDFGVRLAGLLAALLVVTACSPFAWSDQPPAHIPEGFVLQWQSDFSNVHSLEDFETTDPKAWKLSDLNGKPALELIGGSRYRYRVQSPSSIAILRTHRFGDFVLDANLVQNGRDYGHRDLCVFFGLQDPGHYYYAHFASKTDDRANQIFIVNETPFTKISTQTTDGSNWGRDAWRKVRVQRIGKQITVWFDDMTKPAMLATDGTFGRGYIGFGSYNDSGMFANIQVWAPSSGDIGAIKVPVDEAKQGKIFSVRQGNDK